MRDNINYSWENRDSEIIPYDEKVNALENAFHHLDGEDKRQLIFRWFYDMKKDDQLTVMTRLIFIGFKQR